MLVSAAISGGIDIVSQLAQNSWNVDCISWVQFAGAVGAGAIGGLIGIYVPAASTGITGLVKLMMLGGVVGIASGIGGRAVMTALSGDWSNWQEEIFSFKRVVADFAFGAAGGGIGFGARQLSDKIKVQPTRQPAKISRSSSTPDFYVTPDGTVLPSTKQGLLKNLDLFTVEGDKYYGFGSNGPIRIRFDLHGHPGSPDFSGPLNPFHETPHIHIEKRIHVISGKWIPQFTFPWDFFK